MQRRSGSYIRTSAAHYPMRGLSSLETVYDVTVVVVGMSNGVKVMASLVAWPWKLYLPWVVPKVSKVSGEALSCPRTCVPSHARIQASTSCTMKSLGFPAELPRGHHTPPRRAGLDVCPVWSGTHAYVVCLSWEKKNMQRRSGALH